MTAICRHYFYVKVYSITPPVHYPAYSVYTNLKQSRTGNKTG